MPLVVFSLLRLALVVACWAALVWAGLDPLIAVVVAALLAWGLSYVALRGPRDAAARWLAEQDARRKAGVSTLSARAQRDAADEDALIDAADERPEAGGDESPEAGDGSHPDPGDGTHLEPGDGAHREPGDGAHLEPGEGMHPEFRAGGNPADGDAQSASPSPSSTP